MKKKVKKLLAEKILEREELKHDWYYLAENPTTTPEIDKLEIEIILLEKLLKQD